MPTFELENCFKRRVSTPLESLVRVRWGMVANCHPKLWPLLWSRQNSFNSLAPLRCSWALLVIIWPHYRNFKVHQGLPLLALHLEILSWNLSNQWTFFSVWSLILMSGAPWGIEIYAPNAILKNEYADFNSKLRSVKRIATTSNETLTFRTLLQPTSSSIWLPAGRLNGILCWRHLKTRQMCLRI